MTAHSHALHLVDVTFPSPAENLACDEVLLNACEAHGGQGVLRFWEPREVFVVVGYTNAVEREVHIGRCREDGVPVLRRISGGGAVVQGAGCLNYALVLPHAGDPRHATLTGTNHVVMERMCSAIAPLLPGASLAVKGDTDLTLDGSKISGNSHRRGTRYVLFHGVFLCTFDLTLMEKYLPFPSRQPSYRDNRPHGSFVTNAGVTPQDLKRVIAQVWNAGGPSPDVDREAVRHLAETRYSLASWNIHRTR